MYTWEGSADLWSSPSIQLQGSTSGSAAAVTWKLKIRVHTNAENNARTYFSISNGESSLFSETVSAVSYETDTDNPEWRRIATFEGTFSPPSGSTFDEWFSGVNQLSVSSIGYDTSFIPGGIAELLYAEVVPVDRTWESVYFDGTNWQEWEAAYWNGTDWEAREFLYYNGTDW